MILRQSGRVTENMIFSSRYESCKPEHQCVLQLRGLIFRGLLISSYMECHLYLDKHSVLCFENIFHVRLLKCIVENKWTSPHPGEV